MGVSFDDDLNRREELKNARHLAFNDFYDTSESGAPRKETADVLETIFKLEMEQEKIDRELTLKGELNEHQMELEDKKFEFEKEKAEEEAIRKDEALEMEKYKIDRDIALKKSFNEEQLKLDREKFEFEKEKAEREDARREAEKNLNYLKAGADFTVASASLGLSAVELVEIVKSKEKPIMFDRASLESYRRFIEKASRYAGKIFRR